MAQQVTHPPPLLLGEVVLVHEVVVERVDGVQHELDLVPVDELLLQALPGHPPLEVEEGRQLHVVVQEDPLAT
jgi:hypothetical protein